jgi:hypothetical protein
MQDKAIKYKEENHINLFQETSAAEGDGCKQIFVEAAKLLYEDYLTYNTSKSKESITGYLGTSGEKYESNQKLPNKTNKLDNSIKIEKSALTQKKSKCKC